MDDQYDEFKVSYNFHIFLKINLRINLIYLKYLKLTLNLFIDIHWLRHRRQSYQRQIACRCSRRWRWRGQKEKEKEGQVMSIMGIKKVEFVKGLFNRSYIRFIYTSIENIHSQYLAPMAPAPLSLAYDPYSSGWWIQSESSGGRLFLSHITQPGTSNYSSRYGYIWEWR